MAEKTNIPQVRFSGFDKDWEKQKFDDILEKYEDPVATPHDGYERLGVRSHVKGTFHSYVAPGAELETAQMHRVAANKLLFNITFAWEHAVAITDEDDAGKLVSHRFPQFTFAQEMDPKFFRYVIADETFRYHLWLSSPGGAGRNRVLNIPEMMEYQAYLPEKAEQTQLADWFSVLDELIAQHQSKLEKLQALKISMLEKMFPKDGEKIPEIRFRGFTEVWKRYSFSALYSPMNERNNELLPYNKTLSIATMTYKSDGNGAADESLSNYKRLRLGDIAFEGHTSKEFRYGRFVLNDVGDGIMSPRFTALRPLIDFPIYFWKYYIHYEPIMKRILVNSTKAGTMMNELVVDDFLKESILVPSAEEQQLIGSFFNSIDVRISLGKQELNKLQTLKKGLLEKMFV